MCGLEPGTLADYIIIILLVIHAVLFAVQAWSLKKSVIDAGNKEQRELRAYIHLTDHKIIGVDDLNSLTKFIPANWDKDTAIVPPKSFGEAKISYKITFRNFGQTPAHDVMGDARTKVATYPLSLNHRNMLPPLVTRKDLQIRSNGLHDVLIDGSLGPGGENDLEISLPALTENEILLLTLGGDNAAIYFYGRIEYRDAFNQDRETNFLLCHRKGGRTEDYTDNFLVWINGNKAT